MNNNNSMKLIDFTVGIRSEDIQHNFNVLEDRVNRERKNVGGPGIASGLEITINVDDTHFEIETSDASIITVDGDEIFIPKQVIPIERPKLSHEKEFVNADYNNKVNLKHAPYALHRKYPSDQLETFLERDTGIHINYQNSQNEDDGIKVANIIGSTLVLTRLTRRDLEITYPYTAKRIDTVYVDNDYKIKVASGITSTTPTAIIPKEYKYLIAFIEIDPYFIDENKAMFANIIFRQDLREVRNLYTDKNGKLWICGVPFNNLQIIHLTEPKDPVPNSFWYDSSCNQIKIWRSTDKLIYSNEYITSVDFELYPDALKDYDTDVHYKAGGSQLSVYVNGKRLSKQDEYIELNDLGLPVDDIDIQKGIYCNQFRVLANLKSGDKIAYRIESFDSHYMWIPINNKSYINTKDIKMFGPGDLFTENYYTSPGALAMGIDENKYPHKYRYFFFHYEKEKNMLFTPGVNELEILINQMQLHSDQFEEITMDDLVYNYKKFPDSVLFSTAEFYGYTEQVLKNINGAYENTGIGFRLIEPLDVGIGEELNGPKDLFIEANVIRRVNDSPLKRKLQRTANFICEKEIKYESGLDENLQYIYSIPTDEDGNYTINIDEYHRYGENQLEVFINGKKLSIQDDIIEGSDLDGEAGLNDDGNVIFPAERTRGARTRQFKIKKHIALNLGDVVTYRINSTVYTYDHINQLLEDMDNNAEAAVIKVDEVYDKTVEIQNKVEAKFEILDEQIEEIRELATNFDDKYLEKDDPVLEAQLPSWMVFNAIKSVEHINTPCIIYQGGQDQYDVTDFVKEEDFIVAYHRSKQNSLDKFFIRNHDYELLNTYENNTKYVSTILRITEEGKANLNPFDEILLTGIKISPYWRK